MHATTGRVDEAFVDTAPGFVDTGSLHADVAYAGGGRWVLFLPGPAGLALGLRHHHGHGLRLGLRLCLVNCTRQATVIATAIANAIAFAITTAFGTAIGTAIALAMAVATSMPAGVAQFTFGRAGEEWPTQPAWLSR